ncbi:MAG: hypothetical protein U0746_05515 [Gemmataceae bacterium]
MPPFLLRSFSRRELLALLVVVLAACSAWTGFVLWHFLHANDRMYYLFPIGVVLDVGGIVVLASVARRLLDTGRVAAVILAVVFFFLGVPAIIMGVFQACAAVDQ